MSTKCSSGAVPGGVLPSFSPWKKKVAARRRRNSPAKRAIQRPDEGIGPYKKAFYHRPLIRLAFGQPPFPIPSGLRPSPLDKGSRPPRGKAFRGECPLIRPLRGHLPPRGGRLLGGVPPHPASSGPPSPQGEGFFGESPLSAPGKDLGRRAAQCAAPTRKAAKRYI